MDERAVEPVELIISRFPRRVTQIGVRRIADARLFANWSPQMEKAAQSIHDGFRGITEHLQIKPQCLERMDNPALGTARDYVADCITWWWRWGHEMQRSRMPIAPITDVLVEGKSCRECDAERRKRHGWAKIRIDEGLTVYCKLRGWT